MTEETNGRGTSIPRGYQQELARTSGRSLVPDQHAAGSARLRAAVCQERRHAVGHADGGLSTNYSWVSLGKFK